MKILKKELLIFIVLFFISAFLMHSNSWLNFPLEHLNNLANHSNPFHPVFYVAVLYIILGFFRFLFRFVYRLFVRK